jgi:hypothetical protein
VAGSERPDDVAGTLSLTTGRNAFAGRIEVRWSLAPCRLDVTVPPGTSAEVTLPSGSTLTLGPGAHQL